MANIPTGILYIFFFISLYFEVFLLITYFENRKKLEEEEQIEEPKKVPSVSILVPCYNEEKTIVGTIQSLLALDYPKDKLSIIIINDGSTDNTAQVIKQFEKHPQISLHNKENGGKYTALNYGLKHTKSELIGCLDADSFVDSGALKKIVRYFENNEVMAVIPSIKVHNPKNILQHVQRVEYSWGIFLKKMLSYMGALYVTPGPFSIIRKKVYDTLGPYKHAHNTEDLEIALRMQAHRYKIVTAHKAFVYTVTPPNVYSLYKQRLRWTYGFIKNAIDYKHLFFNNNTGTLGFLVLPLGLLSIGSVLYFTSFAAFNIIQVLGRKYVEIQTIGFNFSWKFLSFDPFYINTQTIAFIGGILFLMSFSLLLMGRKMADGRFKPLSLDIFYFLFIYPFIAPLWIGKALFNALVSKESSWR